MRNLLRRLWCWIRRRPYCRMERVRLRVFLDGREIPVEQATFQLMTPSRPLESPRHFRADEGFNVIRSEGWKKAMMIQGPPEPGK